MRQAIEWAAIGGGIACVIGLSGVSLLAAESLRRDLERARLENGAMVQVIPFSTHTLFPESGLSLDQNAKEEYEAQIAAVLEAGLIPLGAITSWVFPDWVEPPRVPAVSIPLLPGIRRVRLACVPQGDKVEYARLRQSRAELVSTLAREFPQLDTWLVGNEPGFPYFDCEGQPLEPHAVIPFIVDTLSDVASSVRGRHPEARIVAHFLGRTISPLVIAGSQVQPKELITRVNAEIDARGSRDQYYDVWVTSIDPSLAEDRQEEEHQPMDFSTRSAGWNVKWLEEFTTTADDLVDDYSDWNSWRTDTQKVLVTTVPVASGKAYIELEDPRPDLDWSIGGAVTSGSVDVVPDEEFDADTYQRNRWTAVSDFQAASSTNPAGAHSAVFIRVNDTEWEEVEDQTRFGAIVFGGNVSAGNCSNEPCGALQFTGESGDTVLWTFELDELPASNPTHLYRVQIHEREYLHPLNWTWELQWMAEVWDLSEEPFQLIGASVDWIWEYTVENVWGIEIPGLEDSKLAFGLGPGWDGDQTVERTGTAYWIY